MQGLRWGCWLSVLSAAAAAQPTNLSVAGATNTQLLVTYRAPDPGSCSISAANTDDPLVVAYDVDESKFPGSSLDSRHSWNVGVLNRVVVLGKRTSDTSPDGKLYSRALEADVHYTVGVTCGGETVKIDTQTDWLPAGNLFPETPPFNPSGFGNYAWPTIDWKDRSQPRIDPMSGVKVKFTSFPGDWSNKTTGLFGSDFWVDFSRASWMNPQNATSGTADRLATYTGSGNEALFVGVDPATARGLSGGWSKGESPWSVDDFGVHVTGFGSEPLAENRTVSICLSIDSGQSCFTRSFTVVLPATTPADSGVQPASFPAPMFAGWGKAPDRSQLPTQGVVDLAGNLLTLTGNQDGDTFFSPALAPGSKIWVAKSAPACSHNLCTVTAVVDATHLLLAESVNLTGANATLANFGVRIVKTTGVGFISLSLSYENAWSVSETMPFSGITEMCSTIPVQVGVDAAGRPLPGGTMLTGYNCAVSGNWYWISSDTGESRLISVTNPPASAALLTTDPRDAPSVIQAPPGVMAFDAQQANVGYTYAKLAAGGNALFKLTYTGDYRALNYNYPTGNGGELPQSVDDKITWANVSPASQAKDLTTQVIAAGYDVAKYGEVSQFTGISGDHAVFLRLTGGQDSPCWVFLYNLKTQTLDYGFNSWDGTFHPSLRWQGCHSGGPLPPADTAFIANKPLYAKNNTSTYGGPFVTNVTSVLRTDGTFDSNTSIPSDPDNSYQAMCPDGLGPAFASLTGTPQCVTIHVSGEACSSYATANELIWSPCPGDNTKSMLQPMAVGDYIFDTTGPVDNERMIIVRKTMLPTSEIELVLQRLPGPYCGILPSQRLHPNGWTLQMAASGPTTCEGGLLVLDITAKQIYLESRFLLSGHFDFGMGVNPGTYTFVGVGFDQDQLAYTIRSNSLITSVGQPANHFVTEDPKFTGVDGLSVYALQSYASKHQWLAVGDERRWALDFRHMNGSYGFLEDSPFTALALTSTTLVPGTVHVFKTTIVGNSVNVKRAPLLGFAGRFLLQEKSSSATGNTLTDSDIYRFCYAYRDQECRQDAKAGDAFVSVPAATLTGACQAGQLARSIPCLMTSHSLGAWAVQFDTTQTDTVGGTYRHLTMGFMGPGRQYSYGNLRALPDGKWAMMSGWWIDGVRQDVLLVKLPPYHATSANASGLRSPRQAALTTNPNRIARTDFVPVEVRVDAVPNAKQAIVDFGYGENGSPASFFCTARAESCHTVSASIDPAQPFLYSSEVTQGAPCDSGCTFDIPALAARVLYYQIRYLDSQGAVVQTSPLQIRVSSEERIAGETTAVFAQ
jgi:hypothetical protein